jgi:uncharacterized protein (DUF58 family)
VTPSPSITAEQLKAVRALDLRARGLLNSLFAGDYRSVFRGQGMEFAEVRAYEPGDDVRHIDWNVSARSSQLYVKTFTEERELTVFVIIDRSASTAVGSTRVKSDLATEVGAVLGLAAAAQQDRVGALLFTDRVEQVIPPQKGRRHALRVVRDLVTFQPAGTGTDLAAALTYAGRLLQHRSVVVVLSDFAAAEWERPMRMLAARHEVVAVLLRDAIDGSWPSAGWIEVADAERGGRQLVDTRDPEVRARVGAADRLRRSVALAALRRSGADAVELATGDPWILPLRRVFEARARRRGHR